MTWLRLIVENSLRSLKSTDGRISVATKTILLFFLLTLSLTSASIQHYLSDNLTQMLGSDLVLERHSPFSRAQEEGLRSLAQRTSVTRLRDINMTHRGAWARVSLKLVDDAYPLQGRLLIGDTPAAKQEAVTHGPEAGDIWLDPRLATQLKVSVGDVIYIGDAGLRFSAILLHEPDRLLEGHSTTMRAMVHADSLVSSEIVAGNIRTRYLVAADDSQQQAIATWAANAVPGAEVIKRVGGEHPLAGFWRRAEKFLGMSSVILFLMGAVALDMTSRRWLVVVRYQLALYASFGVHPRTAIAMAVGEWLIALLLSLLVASLAAAVAYSLIVEHLQAYFQGLLALWHWNPVLKTAGVTALLLLALQVPSFLQLSRTSLLSLIRNPAKDGRASDRFLWSFGSVALLAAAYSDNWLLTGMTLAAIASAFVLMIALTWVVVRLGDSWGHGRAGLLSFAFFMMQRRLFSKSVQVVGFGLCGLLLLISLMLMRDLRSTMDGYTRTHDGNLMIADAQSSQIQSILRWASDTSSSVRSLRPFVPAQLVAVNGESVAGHAGAPSDTLSALKYPIRLSWADKLPKNNRLAGGKWWPEEAADWQQISAESEVMTDIGLRYGDVLTYQINGGLFEFTLVASHEMKPGSGSITFWFQVPLSAKAKMNAPVHYMGSLELPESAWDSLGNLWEEHPTLSLVPLKELTERFDRTLGVLAKMASGYSAMMLVLAILVLTASVVSFGANDRQKNGLLKSMGVTDDECLRLSLYDWGITAAIAASGAVAGALIAGQMIYKSQFNLVYDPDPVWLVGAVVVMQSVVCLIGYIVSRVSLRVSVRDLLAT